MLPCAGLFALRPLSWGGAHQAAAGAVTVRYGHGQGVRCIVRLGDGLQVQHDAGHFLDLLFYRLAIPGHSLLDLHGNSR